MARLMRGYAWDATPLGPPEGWPQSLNTALSIVLGSRYPMFIWWGPDLLSLYNDAYMHIMGPEKHPRFLGRSGRDCWAEIWDVVGPMTEQVLRAGSATWAEDLQLALRRYGYVEETFFTFSYSPILGEEGQVAGLFAAVYETTERVLAERRLSVLRELSVEATDTEGALRKIEQVLSCAGLDIPLSRIFTPDVSISTGGRSNVPEVWSLANLVDAAGRLQALAEPEAAGPWPEVVTQAYVVPIPRGGSRGADAAVFGISPRRTFDEKYQTFLDLVAGRVGAALDTAAAFEEERKRAEALAELDRAKTLFFSNVSHEFRTPLTLMLGPLEDIQASPDLNAPEVRLNVQTSYRNALRLLRLVNTLLDFSRIESGRIEAVYGRTDIGELTKDLASSFRSAVERAGLRLKVDCPAPSQEVFLDRDMWEKIVLNLLSNALKFTFDGEISVSLAEGDGWVELAVSDTGTGIRAEDLTRVFERFYRIRDAQSRTFEGSGIGLALVRELARLHGGDVTVESSYGQGSTFRVRIPTGSAHLPAEKVGAARTLDSTATGVMPFVEEALRWVGDGEPGNGDGISAGPTDPAAARNSDSTALPDAGTVIIADDNADMRDYISHLLSGRWNVIAVPDGRSALAQVLSRKVDLVLSDIMMPGMDGFELVEALRNRPHTASLPIILLSARAGEESRIEGLEAGADDYLVKPFSARELIARVESHLELAALRRQRETAIKESEERLARQREEMYDLFMQAPISIAVLRGPDLIYELANGLATQAAGREVVGKSYFEVLPELANTAVGESLLGVIETGEAFRLSEVELHSLIDGKPDGTWWNFVFSPIQEPGGRVERVMALGVEITQEVLARRRMEEAASLKDQFLGLVSHELRTPISTVVANALILLRRGEALRPDDRTQALQDIADEGQRLQRVIENLLMLTRMDATDGPEFGALDLRTVLKGELEAFSRQNPARPVVVDLGVAPAVNGEESLIAIVVSNLLGNAHKYSPPESSITVRLATNRDGEAEVRVRDEGIGIKDSELANLFVPFYRTDAAKSYATGMGLGLAVCKRILEFHGGRIWAMAADGGGSEFCFTLPAGPTSAASAAS